jgi:hypothetical protein
MERTLAEIENDITNLREHVTKYRRLAEQRRAHGHLSIAEELEKLIGNLEAKVSQLEMLKFRAASSPASSLPASQPSRTA